MDSSHLEPIPEPTKATDRFTFNRFWLCLAILAGVWGATAPASTQATESITLAWDRSTATNVAGYIVRYGTQSGQYTGFVRVGLETMATADGLIEGMKYYFTVSAHTTLGEESDPSPELAYTMPADPRPRLALAPVSYPTRGMRLTFQATIGEQYDLLATEDFRTWTLLWRSPVAPAVAALSFVDTARPSSGRRFYKLKLR